ncbi:hypothetical protein ILUMI_04100 [Ignelater luminosus]|uniref:Uncharacterized protein n=1 Tax=Ignelater luminosus TaxID=2038154 RepID=A0A8K0DEI2_IGNLU|nr:hypothetical protein ILUMI_04100 [Ignelater luminosus]
MKNREITKLTDLAMNRGNEMDNNKRKCKNMKIGIWNITLLKGKEYELVQKMEEYELQVLGISKTEKTGKRKRNIEKYTMYYSGVGKEQRAKERAGIVISERDKQNQIKTNTQDVLEHWRQYYEEKYNSRNENQQDKILHAQEMMEENKHRMEEIDQEELEEAIGRVKTRKASGADRIDQKLIKSDNPMGTTAMTPWDAPNKRNEPEIDFHLDPEISEILENEPAEKTKPTEDKHGSLGSYTQKWTCGQNNLDYPLEMPPDCKLSACASSITSALDSKGNHRATSKTG